MPTGNKEDFFKLSGCPFESRSDMARAVKEVFKEQEGIDTPVTTIMAVVSKAFLPDNPRVSEEYIRRLYATLRARLTSTGRDNEIPKWEAVFQDMLPAPLPAGSRSQTKNSASVKPITYQPQHTAALASLATPCRCQEGVYLPPAVVEVIEAVLGGGVIDKLVAASQLPDVNVSTIRSYLKDLAMATAARQQEQ